MTPGPNEQLSSESATFWPNHTETSSTSTLGSATNAGSVVDIGETAALAHRSTHR